MSQEIYQVEFLSFQGELKSFIYRLVTNHQDAEDIVQDTYIKAFEKINTFKSDSSFKTWVFTIALNIGKNLLNKQNRWIENAQDLGAMLHQVKSGMGSEITAVFHSTPDRDLEIKEHINYCFNCINKTLDLRQQICFLLKEVYEFKVDEIVKIVDLSEGKVKHAIADARGHMIRIFKNRCAFVSKTGVCEQCTALKGILNPEQDALAKANQIKMVKMGQSEEVQKLLDLRLELVRGIDPINSKNFILHNHMLENSEKWVDEGLKLGIEKKVV